MTTGGPSRSMTLPLQLTTATFVLRDKFAASNAVEDVAALISDFLVDDITLSRACELTPVGSSALLDLVWNRGLRGWRVAKFLHSEPHYYRWEFSHALVQAVRRYDFHMINWLLKHFSNCQVFEDVVEEAARGGHLDILQLLEDNTKTHGGIPWRDTGREWTSALEDAAKEGHWEVVHWLDQRVSTAGSREQNASIAGYAILQRNLEQLKWAAEIGFTVDYMSCIDLFEAEWRVCSDIVTYLIEQGAEDVPRVVSYAIEQAAEIGDLEFVNWLALKHVLVRDGDADDDNNDFAVAAMKASENGHLETVKWLLGHINDIDLPHDPSQIMYAAAKSGNLELVEWLYQKYSRDPSVDLFRNQQDESEIYLCLFPSSAMDAAAQRGHLEVLKFLHSVDQSIKKKRKRLPDDNGWKRHRCPMCTSMAMDAAAESGHLNVVKWLHTHRSEGCSAKAMDCAAANGHMEVVKWLHMNRSEGCTTAAMDNVVRRRFHSKEQVMHSDLGYCCRDKEPSTFGEEQLKSLKWFHANRVEGCSMAVMDNAAANGNLKMLEWLHLNVAAPCTRKAMNSAAGLGRLDVVKWLSKNCMQNDSSAALSEAACSGHLSVVQWLLSNYTKMDIMSAMSRAICSRHFDVALVLHEQKAKGDHDVNVRRMKEDADRMTRWHFGCLEIRDWLEEKYPARTDRETINFFA